EICHAGKGCTAGGNDRCCRNAGLFFDTRTNGRGTRQLNGKRGKADHPVEIRQASSAYSEKVACGPSRQKILIEVIGEKIGRAQNCRADSGSSQAGIAGRGGERSRPSAKTANAGRRRSAKLRGAR